MDWSVYVGKDAKNNFELGLSEGVWGHKELKKKIPLKDIAVGDRLFFIHHLKMIPGMHYSKRAGFPRVSIHDFFGITKSIVVAEVIRGYFYSSSTVWPDDTYPHRYEIKILEKHENCIFSSDVFPHELIEATRTSAVGNTGMAIPFSTEEAILLNDEADFLGFDGEAIEGRPILKSHITYERDKSIVREKKKQVMIDKGRLACEACGFDFAKTYGERGHEFIECHHTKPLADAQGTQRTKLSDLALLCSNCHRIVHRSRPWLSIEELKKLISPIR